MPAPVMDNIFKTVTDFSKTMGSLYSDTMRRVMKDIKSFMEKSNDLSSHSQWQGWTGIGISCAASLAVVGSLIPKGADAASTTLNDPRLGANDGIGDTISNALKWIGDQLKSSDFLRTTCKTAAKFFNGINQPVNILFQSKTTQLEAKIKLLEVCFGQGQQTKSAYHQEMDKAQNYAQGILQSYGKNG